MMAEKIEIIEISNTLWVKKLGDWGILFKSNKMQTYAKESGVNVWSWNNNDMENDDFNNDSLDLFSVELNDVIFTKLIQLIPPRSTKIIKRIILGCNYLQNPWDSLAQLDLSSLVYIDLSYNKNNRVIDYEIKNVQNIYPDNLSKLEILLMNSCNLSEQHIQGLTLIKLPKLNTIYLNNNPIGAEGVRCLAKIALISPIKKLSLINCGLNDESLEILSNTNIKLLSLDLNKNHFTHLGIYYLTGMDTTQLKYLLLNGCQLDDIAIRVLSKLQADNLNRLSLANNSFTTQNVEYFVERFYAPQLEHISIDNQPISQILYKIRKDVPVGTCMGFIQKMSINISSNVLNYMYPRNKENDINTIELFNNPSEDEPLLNSYSK